MWRTTSVTPPRSNERHGVPQAMLSCAVCVSTSASVGIANRSAARYASTSTRSSLTEPVTRLLPSAGPEQRHVDPVRDADRAEPAEQRARADEVEQPVGRDDER